MIIQQFINGLSLGSIYALIALGYTMVYGVLRFINFAHGDVFMVGAFIAFYLAPMVFGLIENPIIAGIAVLVLSMLICAVLGVVIERIAYRPLRNRPKISMLITAIGVSLFLESGGQVLFGPDPKPFPSLFPNPFLINTPQVVLTLIPALVIGISIFLMLLMRLIVKKTKIGIAMRAVSQNQTAASLMGIPINRVISFTFALGSALAAAGGVLYASMYPSITPLMGIFPGLKAFIAAVLGGIGSIPGAVLGGFIIGFLETFVTGYISPTYRDAIAFAVLIFILLYKPTGLLGKNVHEKV